MSIIFLMLQQNINILGDDNIPVILFGNDWQIVEPVNDESFGNKLKNYNIQPVW